MIRYKKAPDGMSGLLACVQVVGKEAAAAAAAAADAVESKARKRDKKDKRKADKKERKARKAAKRKADEDGGGGGGKRTRRGSGSDDGSSSSDGDGDARGRGGAAADGARPPDARTEAGLDWMSNPAHQRAARAAPEDAKAVAAAAEAKAKEERRAVRLPLAHAASHRRSARPYVCAVARGWLRPALRCALVAPQSLLGLRLRASLTALARAPCQRARRRWS
jgi:hypothetical protein